MDNTYIQEQHFRINNALSEFKAGSTNSMWAIIQGLHLIQNKTINTTKGIPNTKLFLSDLDAANECEYYITFTTKNAAYINQKIMARSQMYALVSNTKTELYKAYSKYVSENFKDTGINFITNGTYLGER
jgi:hypothetical protein